MTETVLSNMTASITELKVNPMGVMEEAGEAPVAILNRNKPAFYCLSPSLYEQILERLDDAELAALVALRAGEEEVQVDFDQL